MFNKKCFFIAAVFFAVLVASAAAHAGDAALKFAWGYPATESVDGFRLYSRPAGEPVYTDAPVEIEASVCNSGACEYSLTDDNSHKFYVMTAFSGGIESERSNEVEYKPLTPPSNVSVTVQFTYK